MKHLLVWIAALCAAVTGCAADKPLVGATIDFLDYAFGYKGPEDHYPLEVYERELRELAEGGVKKIYLRVNVCGTTHYPTKVSARYGDHDAFHWYAPKPSMILINTYKHYDPCAETIRIGKKYGMEVWAWESLFDDAGVRYGYPTGHPAWEAAWKRLDGWALLDPFYLDNPDALAMRDPRIIPSPEAVEKANREAAEKPIAKIVFTNPEDRRGLPPSRIKSADDLQIFVSTDNRTYKRYPGKFTFAASETSDRRNRFEIDGLAITEPYVKLVHKGMPADNKFSWVLASSRGQCRIYNTDGKLISSVWGWVRDNNPKPGNTVLSLDIGPVAWDYMGREIGFKAGEIEPQRWYYGVAEFNVPKAMKHKVDRFRELTAYPFDGFMFNTRCHSTRPHPEQYGFNPEVMAKFRERYGRDYRGGDGDLEKLFLIRGEAIADFFKNCKALTGGRPIYMSAPMPIEYKDRPGFMKAFGPMPWLYKRYFADKSIDGVMMTGNWRNGVNFSEYFTPEVTQGHPVRIGVFREMLAGRPKGYDFAADLKKIRSEGLDEVELYESAVLNRNPILFRIIKGETPAEWNAATYQWKW